MRYSSDLLKKAVFSKDRFVGHIGGDDFFMGIKCEDSINVIEETKDLADRFKKNAESFYDAQTLKQGFLRAPNRKGVEQDIPLISVSAAILELPANQDRRCSIEDAANIIAQLKKEAKASDSGISHVNIMDVLYPLDSEPKIRVMTQ